MEDVYIYLIAFGTLFILNIVSLLAVCFTKSGKEYLDRLKRTESKGFYYFFYFWMLLVGITYWLTYWGYLLMEKIRNDN